MLHRGGMVLLWLLLLDWLVRLLHGRPCGVCPSLIFVYDSGPYSEYDVQKVQFPRRLLIRCISSCKHGREVTAVQDGNLRVRMLKIKLDQASSDCLVWKGCRIDRWLSVKSKEGIW